jgi:protein TonB
MKSKNITISIILAVIIHIAALTFLFSLQTSTPVIDSDSPVSLVSLVRPKAQTKTLPPKPQIKRTTPKRVSPQISEQAVVPQETATQETVSQETTETEISTETIAPTSTEGNSEAPRALYMPAIPYPRAAKNAKIEGTAEVEYTIDESGRVISVEILSVPHISFTKIIERTVLSWRFSPATQSGKPVSITANKTIVFRLD